ncbi:hypothetical protein [Mycolicibacterium goodii]|uniref:hypothetical protein n=1 Tax=Mycolicibacterium goodii TaxID=134601 RepID=UPI00256F577A|nr:hypothetical protein [Mycolicibacterium goodii]
MRILQVATLFSPDGRYGGPARVALNQSAELLRRGHDVTVAGAACGYRQLPSELNGITVKLFAAKSILPRSGFAWTCAPGLGKSRGVVEFREPGVTVPGVSLPGLGWAIA